MINKRKLLLSTAGVIAAPSVLRAQGVPGISNLLMVNRYKGLIDGLGASGGWSFSRRLSANYSGPFYSLTAGAVSTLYDQSGSARDFTQSSAGFRPLLSPAPNGIICGLWDGADDLMSTAALLSSFITGPSGFAVVTTVPAAITLNNANVYQNNGVFSDSGSFWGVFGKSVGGTTPTWFGYNWDGNADSPTGTAFALNVPYVLSWRHSAGSIIFGVNGVEQSTPSGDTLTLTGTVRLGAAGASTNYNGKIAEFVTFPTPPSAENRLAIIRNMGRWVGAL